MSRNDDDMDNSQQKPVPARSAKSRQKRRMKKMKRVKRCDDIPAITDEIPETIKSSVTDDEMDQNAYLNSLIGITNPTETPQTKPSARKPLQESESSTKSKSPNDPVLNGDHMTFFGHMAEILNTITAQMIQYPILTMAAVTLLVICSLRY